MPIAWSAQYMTGSRASGGPGRLECRAMEADARPVANASVLFVCTGNICRSPTGEAVLRERAARAGLALHVDSAGTHGYHVGEPADPRSIAAAARRGYDLSPQRARKVERIDFERFDHVLALDRGHQAILARLAKPSQGHKLTLALDWSARFAGQDVPDPYYGGAEGFELVLDMLEDAADGMIAALRDSRKG